MQELIKKDYNKYVLKYKELCKKENRVIKSNELFNNKYGLPNMSYFIKYCTDKNVKTFRDFTKWCGLIRTENYRMTKEEVSKILLEYQFKIGVNNPITENDITLDKVGFSMIVIKRLYGTLIKAKEEIGLNLDVHTYEGNSFEYYKNKLDYVLNKLNTKIISWNDLENYKIENDNNINHKSMMKSFNDKGLDFYAYIKEKGFIMNQNLFSSKFVFDDGEKTLSNYEYLFSRYLKELGLIYKKDYLRDVMYKTIDKNLNGRKINCDYLINNIYIEIAGVLNPISKNWRTEEYDSDIKNKYRDKMIWKENILLNNNCNYIFLFKDDFENGNYKNIINKIIERK